VASDGTVKRPIFTYTKSDKIPLLVENKNLIKKKIEEKGSKTLSSEEGQFRETKAKNRKRSA